MAESVLAVDGRQVEQGIKLFGTMIMLKQEANYDPKCGDDHPTTDKRQETVIPCPRCKSMDTKFCYFNNYNVNQPRHFCRGCQRYWTAGGALRNVPVGAGRRKNKPPERVDLAAFPGNHCSLFDAAAAAASAGVHHFSGHVDGMTVQEWRLAVAGGSLGHEFQAYKRRRIMDDF